MAKIISTSDIKYTIIPVGDEDINWADRSDVNERATVIGTIRDGVFCDDKLNEVPDHWSMKLGDVLNGDSWFVFETVPSQAGVELSNILDERKITIGEFDILKVDDFYVALVTEWDN